MRLFYCLLLLCLCSCTVTTLPEVLVPADQQLFTQGMEQLESQGEPSAFAALQRDYPDSPWNRRAQTVEKLLQTISEQQQHLDRLQREQRRCLQEDEILRQQKQALEDDLQRLKQLLIDLETRR